MGTTAEGKPIRVFVLDNHEAYLAGISRVIDAEPDLEIIDRTTIRSHALEKVAACRPDVAVLDTFPDGSAGAMTGLDICRMIRSAHPEVACLMVTAFPDDQALVDAGPAGASAFVLKQIRSDERLTAIRLVDKGANLLDPAEVLSAAARLER